MVCDFTNATDKQYTSCCIEHDTYGGICVESREADMSTLGEYRMTNDNFSTWYQNPQVLFGNHSGWEVPNSHDYVFAFNRFACTAVDETHLKCYKWQPLTTTTISGEPRWDSNSSGTAYFYDNGAVSPFTTKTFVAGELAGASTMIASLAVVSALLVTF